MLTINDQFLEAIETHDVSELATLIDRGVNVQLPIYGVLPVDHLLEMYTRSDQFADCVRLFLSRGAEIADDRLVPVLRNDPEELRALIARDASLVHHRVSLRSAFTSLTGATLLHVAAEYGHAAVAQVLIEHGADVNARAAFDAYGLNGQTPIFHTVNSNANRSQNLMKLLLAAGADPSLRLEGVVWGRGFAWETTLIDVTPISYAQLGMLPQLHRKELDCYENMQLLLAAAGRVVPPFNNVPNRYLKS